MPTPIPLPIVWYLDYTQLPAGENRSDCIEQIIEAIRAWELNGKQSYDQLQATIETILESCSPQDPPVA